MQIMRRFLSLHLQFLAIIIAALFLSACQNPLADNGSDDGENNGAAPENEAPVATGEASISASVGDTVSFEVSVTDPDGDELSFSWSFASLPETSALTNQDIADARSLEASFVPDFPGTYQLVLTVSDGANSSTFNVSVTVTAGPPGSPAPDTPLDGAEEPPALPSEAVPPDGATGVSVDTQLSWSSAGAVSFDLSFDTQSTPTLLETSIEASNYDPSPEGSLDYETTYYWRVEAVNTSGTREGPVWSFTTEDAPLPETPTLTAPANGASLLSTSPTLTWEAAELATSYTVYTNTTSDFGTASVQAQGLTETSLQLDGLANDTTYYWWVEARNGYLGQGETGPLGGPYSFTTIVALPAAPVLASPSNGYLTNDNSVTLDWNSAARAEEYVLYVGVSDIFALATERYRGSSTSYQMSSLPSSTYYWWVEARNQAVGAGEEGPTNGPRTFTVDRVAPAAPEVTSPGVLVTLPYSGSVAVAFEFSTDALDVSHYQCRVYPTWNFGSTPAFENCSSGWTYTFTSTEEYQFEVRAVDEAGNTSATTEHVFEVSPFG